MSKTCQIMKLADIFWVAAGSMENELPRSFSIDPGSRGGGGYLVYLTDGDVPFFRVSFSPIFSRTGYQKKANFLEQVVKTCKKRKFC